MTAEPTIIFNPALGYRVPPRFAFSRASGGGYYASNGLWANAEANQPRIAFDGKGNCRGVAIEPLSQNLLFRNRDFARTSNWNMPTPATISMHPTEIAPDGSLTVGTETDGDNTSSGRYFINSNLVPYSSSVQYVVSRFYKNGSGLTRYPGMILPTAVFGTNVSYSFTLSGDGSYTRITAGTNDSAGIVNVGNGWYLCWISAQASPTGGVANAGIQYRITNSTANFSPYVGNTTSNILMWGGNVETGTYPTSLMDTSGLAAVTRQPDALSIAPIYEYISNNEGTFAWEGDFNGLTALDNMIAISNGSITDAIYLELSATAFNTLRARMRAGGTQQGTINLQTNLALQTRYKAAVSWDINGISGACNGVLGNPVAGPITLPVGLNQILIGAAGVAGTTMNGACASFRLWSKRLADTFLQELTV